MKILNTDFSEKAAKEFEKLTREKQLEYLKERNKLLSLEEIKKHLKGVKYGKLPRTKKQAKKSTKKDNTQQDN